MAAIGWLLRGGVGGGRMHMGVLVHHRVGNAVDVRMVVRAVGVVVCVLVLDALVPMRVLVPVADGEGDAEPADQECHDLASGDGLRQRSP